jgi:uncharacterized membrane protein
MHQGGYLYFFLFMNLFIYFIYLLMYLFIYYLRSLKSEYSISTSQHNTRSDISY